MKTKVSPTVVGLFVLGAFALAVIALLAFGGVSFFSQPQRFKIYFKESTHGLDRGSPVNLAGVNIGRVVDLNVRYDEKTNDSVVGVVCEFSRNIITDSQGAPVDVSDRAELQRLVNKGLRAQLSPQSLATGLLFVELDFMNPREFPPEAAPADGKYVVIPAVPSAISEFQQNLTEILNDIKKIDFAGIGAEVKQLLADAHRQLDGVDVKGLVAQWQRTGASVEALASAPEIKATLLHLDDAAVALRVTLAKLDEQVGSGGAELQKTLQQARGTLQAFNEAAASAQRFIQAQHGIGEQTAAALQQLAAAAAAVQQLADFLERNPNALLVGKRRGD